MPRLVCWLLATFLAPLPAAAADAPLPRDVFERDRQIGASAGVERLTTDATLGRPVAEAQLRDWLDRHADAPREQRHDALLALCGIVFRQQRFAEGIAVCGEGEALEPGSAAGLIALLGVRRLAPPTSWSVAGVTLPLTDGRVPIRRGDETVWARIDTGAEIGIVSETLAARLGGRPLAGDVALGTTTTPVAGALVAFDRLSIGGGELRHFAALVVPDAQMEAIGEGIVLDLPSLVAMGRAAFLDHGAVLALGDAVRTGQRWSAPLYWDESGVGFAVDFAQGRRGVHFDTGSNRTWLFPAALAALGEAERATRQPKERVIGGLGGVRREQGSVFDSVRLSIGGAEWRLDRLEMAEADEHGEAARIGMGLFERFSTVVLDFTAMRLELAD